MSMFEKAAKVLDKRSETVKKALFNPNNKFDTSSLDDRMSAVQRMKAKLWDKNVPVVRTDGKGLAGIVRDGEFKNYLETGTTNGGQGGATGLHRKRLEDKNFGTYEKGQRRPIYGYMEHPYSENISPDEIEGRLHSELSEYGPVKFYPKKDFARRTSTFTMGDSEFGGNYPMRWDAEDWQAFARRKEEDNPASTMFIHPNDRTANMMNRAFKDDWFDRNDWAELQFHEGIPLSEIESVTIPQDLNSKYRKKAIDAANKYGFRLDEADLEEIVRRCLANCLE